MTHNAVSFLSSYLQFIGSYGKKYIQKKKNNAKANTFTYPKIEIRFS